MKEKSHYPTVVDVKLKSYAREHLKDEKKAPAKKKTSKKEVKKEAANSY